MIQYAVVTAAAQVAAIAQVQSLAQEIPQAWAVQKKKKKKKKKTEEKDIVSFLYFLSFFLKKGKIWK